MDVFNLYWVQSLCRGEKLSGKRATATLQFLFPENCMFWNGIGDVVKLPLAWLMNILHWILFI